MIKYGIPLNFEKKSNFSQKGVDFLKLEEENKKNNLDIIEKNRGIEWKRGKKKKK